MSLVIYFQLSFISLSLPLSYLVWVCSQFFRIVVSINLPTHMNQNERKNLPRKTTNPPQKIEIIQIPLAVRFCPSIYYSFTRLQNTHVPAGSSQQQKKTEYGRDKKIKWNGGCLEERDIQTHDCQKICFRL